MVLPLPSFRTRPCKQDEGLPTTMAYNEVALLASAAPPPSPEAAPPRRLPSFRVGGHRVAGGGGSWRRKLPTVRLGGKMHGANAVGPQRRRWWWWRGARALAGALRRLRTRRLRWVRLQCARAARALRAFYSGLLRDLVEAAASPGAAQARVMMETYFAIPIMPVSVAAFR